MIVLKNFEVIFIRCKIGSIVGFSDFYKLFIICSENNFVNVGLVGCVCVYGVWFLCCVYSVVLEVVRWELIRC